MKNSVNQRGAGSAPASVVFKLSPVAAGCAVLLSTMVQPVFAQSAPAATDSVQSVTVSGIRRGIEDAISVKKDASSIVEAISAEDIGKLPDTTIAESLARLPGLTTQRTKDGNASTVSIRGLGPDFAGYLLNGREQTSTGDSRSVDLSAYPAELIAGATVYKTTDATVMGAGLAGTIDQQLIDPLAFGGRTIQFKVQRNKNGLGLDVQGKGHRESATYIDQFLNRTVGVAIGFVRQTNDSSQYEFSTWGDYTGPVTTTSGDTVTAKVPGGSGYNAITRNTRDDRKGVAAIIAYKPNRDFNSQIDMFWSKIDDYIKLNQVQIPGTGTFTNATVSNGVVSSATMNNVGLIDRNEGILDKDTIKSIGWKNNLKIGNGWSAMVDLSHNSAERVERDVEYYGGTAANANLTLTGLNNAIPQMSYGNSLTDPSTMAVRNQCGWSGISNNSACGSVSQAGYYKGPTVTDQVNALRAEAKYELPENGYFSNLKFGANFTNRSKKRVADEGVIQSATGDGYDRVAFPSSSTVANNVGGTGLSMLVFDPGVDLIPGTVLTRKYNNDILSKSYGVQEKLTTAYAKLDIDTRVGEFPVSGNVGFQAVHTKQESAGFRANVGSTPTLDNPAPGQQVDGESYNDFLPSLNLNVDLGNSYLARFAASKQVARANMTDLRNSFSFAKNDTPTAVNGVVPPARYEGSSGNPHLKPFRADALDLSLEKYFAKKGYISAAVFYKKLNSYIVSKTDTNYDFTPYLAAFGLPSLAGGNRGIYTTTVNGSGGNLKGAELTASAPFELIHPILNGFGASGSYSSTFSSVKLPNTIGKNPDQVADAGNIPLPGLSKTNAKLQLYFEKWGFSAFVANNYRSRYVGSVANDTVGGFPSLVYIDSQKWLSAQIGYEIQSGPLKGLGLRVEGNNLNSPYYVERNADGSVKTRTQTGRTLFFSVNYKM
ncbi:TonB-dependent receptor [Duganella sp. FT80W]|uniref:TonB-dependent receptor n=1 Tax=Duganella guangzhouensis TaxID=2666084 RepID=A0A6I2L2I7_9BURK|nr:TonB-dependent receptor [Duganella guangzhouensis]MRW92301.1 TonB-dependent receptor [Duganella guangzhouensis]